MLKKTETKTYIPCGQYEKEIKDCENCIFFNGVIQKQDSEEIEGVDCLKKDVPLLNHSHVTEFTRGDDKYSARMYDEEIDGSLKEECNYCEKCCFNKVLQNGEEACLLRSGVAETEPGYISMFCCYEGEIWKKQIK